MASVLNGEGDRWLMDGSRERRVEGSDWEDEGWFDFASLHRQTSLRDDVAADKRAHRRPRQRQTVFSHLYLRIKFKDGGITYFIVHKSHVNYLHLGSYGDGGNY